MARRRAVQGIQRPGQQKKNRFRVDAFGPGGKKQGRRRRAGAEAFGLDGKSQGHTGAPPPRGKRKGRGPSKPKPKVRKPRPAVERDTHGSAYGFLEDFFRELGMDITADLDGIIREMMLGGYTADDIPLFMPDIQQTKGFKKRFTGWQRRIDNGYNVLDIGEYLALEDQYHRIMEMAGLPAGFYDDPSDFGKWIAEDVSPDEVQSRVQMGVDAAKRIDPTMRQLMSRFYGLTTGDVAAYFLDQKRALPTIERQYQAAGVATWAQTNGLAVESMRRFEDLVDKGVTMEQAAAGYGTVAQLSGTLGSMASRYGDTFTQTDAEADVFFNDSEKRQKLIAKESSAWSGSSAGMPGSATRSPY